MGDMTRSGGIPRLQPTGKPGFPGVNGGEGQRFTTGRAGATYRRNGSKPRTGSPKNGPGESYLAARQKRVP